MFIQLDKSGASISDLASDSHKQRCHKTNLMGVVKWENVSAGYRPVPVTAFT